MLRLFRKLARDQRGGGNLITFLAIAVGIVAITPFIVDIASTQIARRMAQTGSDSGSLAGAKEIAIILSERTEMVSDHVWYPTEFQARDAAKRIAFATYLRTRYGRALSAHGRVRAKIEQFAQANGTELDTGSVFIHASPYFTPIESYGHLSDIWVGCGVEREVSTFMRKFYGRDFEAPANATAEVHLDYHRFDVNIVVHYVPCGEATCTVYEGYGRLVTRWKIHLVKGDS